MYQEGETKTEKYFKITKNVLCPQYRYRELLGEGK